MFSEPVQSSLSRAHLGDADTTVSPRRAVPCLDTAPDALPTAQGHYLPKRARPSIHRRRTPQIMIMTDTDTDTTPPVPTDGDKPEPEPDRTRVKPTLTAVSLGSAVQLQLRLDSDDHDHDDGDFDVDDEQDYNRDFDSSDDDNPKRSRSRSPSPVPHAPTTPPTQQQQTQPTPMPTPTPNPFAAHVHFHSRVRITSGLPRSRGNRTLGDSSDSDSPSSSISVPLRYHSRSAVPRLPLGERVSRLAAQALQKRRIAAATAAAMGSSAAATASRRFRARHHEYTPFLRAGVPVTYGTAQRGYSGVADDADSEDENPSQFGDLYGGGGIAFGRWPWRALNRQVSRACGFFFVQDAQFTMIIPLSGGSGRSNQPCVAAVPMSLILTNDQTH